jgi:hypothetical protein
MKSDNEPAILALEEAVRRESDVEIVMEEVPVADHQANGLVENAIKNVQGQFRVIKDALESRQGRRIDGEHPVVPWMVMHAASVVNRSRKDDEGFSAYRRWKGREFTKPVAEFGECVLYAPAASAGKDKFDARWKEGVWLGVRMESGESLIGTDGGVVKARDFRRKAENGGRWSVTEFDKFVGVPWEPYPGAKGGFELKSKVRLPTEHAELTETVTGKSDFVRRRFRIKKDDLEKFGYTTGCPGCRAVNRGTTAANHSEECRSRIAAELEKVGDARLERETERLFEHLEEEEKKKTGQVNQRPEQAKTRRQE